MSNVTYDANTMIVTVDAVGIDRVERALGELKRKAPAAAKVAINATARQTRKIMTSKAKARYAVNAAGAKHLKDLVQGTRASNTRLSTELHIASYRNDLGYFKSHPTKPFIGTNVANAPEFFTSKVLKSSNMTPLTGRGNLSKGFLLPFASGHIGMVQRVIGSHSSRHTTAKGYPRWRNAAGDVEKLQTMGSPSAAAMHRTVWWDAEPEVEDYLLQRLDEQVQKVLARAEARKAKA